MPFSIVVDSCCDLTERMEKIGLYRSVPLSIYVGGREFRDDAHLDVAELVDAMAACQEASHSSCPSPADYLSAYEACEGDIYVVTLSALLSGSCNSAWQAARLFLEEHPERRVHVFNSCSASAGETLIAGRTAQLAGSGLPFDEVVSGVNSYITGMQTLFVLDNLDNLKKAGRLTKAQALITGALRVKLVMGSTPEGEICKRGQALSTRQALSKMTSLMAADPGHRGRILCITHCLCRERADELAVMAQKYCDFSRVIITRTRGISSFYANAGGIIAAY